MSEARRITHALGGRWQGKSGIACCPAHDDHNPSLSLADGDDGRLLAYCHAGCSFADVRAALQRRGLLDTWPRVNRADPMKEPAARERDRMEKKRAAERARVAENRRAARARSLWEKAGPIGQTPGSRYLKYRGITCTLPNTLRYISHCPHPSANSRETPGIVARVAGAENFSIHRTYLKPDGSGKSDKDPAKAMLGPTAGGAVHLSHGADRLVVVEGIETGLSLLSGLLDRPANVWAALSATGMAKLNLPARPGDLVIAPDGDLAGRNAADTLARRARGFGWRVTIWSAPDGADWNDVLVGKAVAS